MYCARFWDERHVVAGGSGTNDLKLINVIENQVRMEDFFIRSWFCVALFLLIIIFSVCVEYHTNSQISKIDIQKQIR